jgi:hypothetical protein
MIKSEASPCPSRGGETVGSAAAKYTNNVHSIIHHVSPPREGQGEALNFYFYEKNHNLFRPCTKHYGDERARQCSLGSRL